MDLSVWLLAATIAACAMILSARILHEKTPDKKEPAILNFLADTSYGVYLFHWPFFIIFSQHLGNMMAALVTTILSLILTALILLYFGANHCRQGTSCLWYEDGSQLFDQADLLSYDSIGLLMIGISAFAPTVGALMRAFGKSGLNQADSKMQVTRTQVDNATATDYNVSNGVTMIGDSVNLRAQDYLTKPSLGSRSMQW